MKKELVRRVLFIGHALLTVTLAVLFLVEWRIDGFTTRRVVYYVVMGLSVTCGFMTVWLMGRQERRKAASDSPEPAAGGDSVPGASRGASASDASGASGFSAPSGSSTTPDPSGPSGRGGRG